jgi:3-oxoacyl-[acyl-carrier-protein] synthase II
MAATSRRAVITGVGVVTSIGKEAATFWQSLLAGRSGVRRITAVDTGKLPVHIAAEIPDFDARDFVEKKERKGLRVMARTIQLAVAAAGRALEDGKVEKDRLDPARFGCAFGSGMIATELEDLGDASVLCGDGRPDQVDMEKWGTAGLETVEPLWMLKYLPNMLACHVSILHNAQGPNNTITENDVASLLAVGEAYRILQRDQADFFLVGGAESRINPLSLVRQSLFGELSKNDERPEEACRPFDRRRDGTVLGEGGGVLVIEELEHARRRGARVYAEVVGFGASFDRERSGSGMARAIRAALGDAGVGPEDVDHVNAHGYGTVRGDAWEARGIREAFAGRKEPVPVFAAKGYFGNLGAGAGTTELAASALAVTHGVLPPTLNFREPDPECPVHVAAGAARPVARPYFVKISFTELGQCAAVVCRKA